MKTTKDFDVRELVSKELYSRFGENITYFLNPVMVYQLRELRSYLNKSLIINNWHVGGNYNESGLRAPRSPVGATYSRHKFGCALDIKSPQISSAELWELLYKKHAGFAITELENKEITKTWTHVGWGYGKFRVINP